MSLLPQQILPQTTPIGRAGPDGLVQMDVNWWLFLYNLGQNVLGTSQGGSPAGLPASSLTELAALDSDVSDSDAVVLRKPISNLQVQVELETDPVPYYAIRNSLILAQDTLLQDPQPQSQPAANVAPTGSPFAYTAPADGTVVVTGGTVSAISITRQTTSVATGLTVGVFPVSRLDILTVTYSPSAPTMTFLPR